MEQMIFSADWFMVAAPPGLHDGWIQTETKGFKVEIDSSPLILAQSGCCAPGASSTSKHKRASVLPVHGRKFKPPASRVMVDSYKMIFLKILERFVSV
jgi:hypothetical protein